MGRQKVTVFASLGRGRRYDGQAFFDNDLSKVIKTDTTIPPCDRRVFPTKADNHILICVLSALRLCVWLFNDINILFNHVDEAFALAFWTKKRKVLQLRILSNSDSRFASTDRAQYPFKKSITHWLSNVCLNRSSSYFINPCLVQYR